MAEPKLVKHIKELYCRFVDDDIPALGAQMAYYLILSFFPFLIFLLTVVSYTPITGDDILLNLSRLLPTTTYQQVQAVVQETVSKRSHALLSLGMLATLWLATNGIVALIRALNKAYDQEEKRPWWKIRLLSLLIVFFLVIAVLLSFLTLIFGEQLGRLAFSYIGLPAVFSYVWQVARFVVPVAALFLTFLFLYLIAPNRKLTLPEVLPGALWATAGWIILSLGFSYYVNHFGSYSLIYGSLGGVIVLLIWIYWSSMIILLGGELNATLTFDKKGMKKPRCKPY